MPCAGRRPGRSGDGTTISAVFPAVFDPVKLYSPCIMELLRPSSGVCGLRSCIRRKNHQFHHVHTFSHLLSARCCGFILLSYTVKYTLFSIDRMYAHLELDLSLSLPFLVVVLFGTSRTKYFRLGRTVL